MPSVRLKQKGHKETEAEARDAGVIQLWPLSQRRPTCYFSKYGDVGPSTPPLLWSESLVLGSGMM